MPREKKQPDPQISKWASEFFGDIIDSPATTPTYMKKPMALFLYVCPQCGWWTISHGVPELFGSLRSRPGPRTEPCERCQHAPMYLVKPNDPLYVPVESQKEVNP